MCGRYTIFTDADEKELLDIISAAGKKYGDFDPFDDDDDGSDGLFASGAVSLPFRTGEIFPSQRVPVLELSGAGSGMSVSLQSWGFPGYGSQLIINARRETAPEKRTFRDSYLSRRCVVPSTGFYEWTHDGERKKYLFNLPESRMLYMAGIWSVFNDVPRFVILTGEANDSISDVHDRMPLILRRESLRPWLTDSAAADELLRAPLPELIRKPA